MDVRSNTTRDAAATGGPPTAIEEGGGSGARFLDDREHTRGGGHLRRSARQEIPGYLRGKYSKDVLGGGGGGGRGGGGVSEVLEVARRDRLSIRDFRVNSKGRYCAQGSDPRMVKILLCEKVRQGEFFLGND